MIHIVLYSSHALTLNTNYNINIQKSLNRVVMDPFCDWKKVPSGESLLFYFFNKTKPWVFVKT